MQKYNADYDLSATQGADTLAFVSLLEEKLLPVLVSIAMEKHPRGGHGVGGRIHPLEGCWWAQACTHQKTLQAAKSWGRGASGAGIRAPGGSCSQGWGLGFTLVLRRRQPCRGLGTDCPPLQIHTFWVDAKNYVEHTRKWYAETVPFPLNFFLPNCMHKRHVERLQLLWGDGYMEDEEKLEKEVRGGGLSTVGPWWGAGLAPAERPLPLVCGVGDNPLSFRSSTGTLGNA